MMRSGVIVAVAASLLVGGACSGAEKPAGPATLDATAAAAAVRALGTVRIAGTTKLRREEGPVDGKVQYAPRRTLEHFGVGADAVLANVEYRRIGDRAWVQAAESTQVPHLGFPILVVRPKGFVRRWQVIDPNSSGIQGLLGRVFDPVDLLTALANAKIVLERDGEGKVGGSSRARYSARIPKDQPPKIGVSALTVFTDANGLPLQFDFSSLSGADGSYTIAAESASVVVEAPPANETALQQKLPTATGPYREVASGMAGAVTYPVLRAPSATDFACWKVASDPKYVTTDEPDKDGGVCVHGITTTSRDLNDQIAIPLDASDKTPYELLGLQVPAGSSVVMHLAGGTQRVVPVDANGLAIDAGPVSPAAGLAVVTLPDKEVAYCAPGAINTLGDLADVDVGEGDALRNQPWNCLEKSLAETLGG
jgi:hypothetical protein